MDFQSDYHLLHENKLPTYFYMDFSLVNLFFFSLPLLHHFIGLPSAYCPISWIILQTILFFSMLNSVQFTLYFAYSISVRWTILLHCSIIKCIHWKITIYLSIYIHFLLLLLLCSFYLRIFFLLDIPNKIDQ